MNIVLKLSKLCNLRCVYCYEYEELGMRDRMPLEGIAYFFESLAQHYLNNRWEHELHFALHGGEPLLLPAEYLRSFVALQQQYLGAKGIPYRNAVQTNLYRITAETITLLEELDIHVGVSVDIFGGQRVAASGKDAQQRVLDNLQFLLDSTATGRIKVGLITVLHALNVDYAAKTFEFCRTLGLDYRILPIFSMADPPARMRHLMLEPAQVVGALQSVALAQFKFAGDSIKVYPLVDYLSAAVRFLSGRRGGQYEPEEMEWALIVNTNGDVYNHSEAYIPGYHMGNVFTDPVEHILQSPGRRAALALRKERKAVCVACKYGWSCSRIPMIEALPSERTYGPSGNLQCVVARPMIEFMADLISRNPKALAAAKGQRHEQPVVCTV